MYIYYHSQTDRKQDLLYFLLIFLCSYLKYAKVSFFINLSLFNIIKCLYIVNMYYVFRMKYEENYSGSSVISEKKKLFTASFKQKFDTLIFRIVYRDRVKQLLFVLQVLVAERSNTR